MESSEEKPSPEMYEKMLLALKKYGVFDVVSGVLVGKPMDETYEDEYKNLLVKTIASPELAYAMMGEVDDSRIEMVQFHQNYSYEDFIMGYRPDGSDFKLTDGIFYRFCQTAANHPDKDYFFIIDEINR